MSKERDALKEDYEDFWANPDGTVEARSYAQEALIHIRQHKKEEHLKVRGKLLAEAMNVINGERQDQYGSPEDSFDLIAKYWTVYTGVQFHASDVAMMMVLFKVAREKGQGKADNVVDGAGYFGLYGDLKGYSK